uniref:Uncharacterized protein n=1 Tax=Ditylenchus dipsaci TaxID=166011 RepID=A0A915CPY0_9BILA
MGRHARRVSRYAKGVDRYAREACSHAREWVDMPLQVICLYSSCFLNQVGRAMFQSCIFFNTLTVFCYLIIWILLVKMKTSHELKETKRIFKSLFLIMCTVVIGWMVNGLLELSLPYFYLSGAQIGINLPVLYFFCTDYTVVNQKRNA